MLFTGVGAIPAMLRRGPAVAAHSAGGCCRSAASDLRASRSLGPDLRHHSPTLWPSALLFVGAGSGALDVAMNAAVSDVEAERGARLMFGAHAMFSLAVLRRRSRHGLRAPGRGASPATCWCTCRCSSPWSRSARSAAARVAREPRCRGTRRGPSSRRRHWARSPFLAALCAAAFLVEDAVQNWSALHLEGSLGAGPALGGAAPGIFAGAMFIGRMLGQRLGDRFSERLLLSGGALGRGDRHGNPGRGADAARRAGRAGHRRRRDQHGRAGAVRPRRAAGQPGRPWRRDRARHGIRLHRLHHRPGARRLHRPGRRPAAPRSARWRCCRSLLAVGGWLVMRRRRRRRRHVRGRRGAAQDEPRLDCGGSVPFSTAVAIVLSAAA